MDKDDYAPPGWVAVPSLQNWLLSVEQLHAKIVILEQLAGPHIAWYTHKNPFSCWICDYIICCRRLLQTVEEMGLYNTKSSLDYMTEDSSQGVRNQDELD